MPVIPINDATDVRLADYRGATDPELARTGGVFVAEGRLVVERLLASTFATRSVMVTRPALEAVDAALAARPDLNVYLVPQGVMNAVSGFNIHRGCLAIGERPGPRRWQDLAPGATRLVALESVGNADNVGATFRASAALGADGVLLDESCTDPLYRKAIRTSMGASLQVPFAHGVTWPDALDGLREAGWSVVGLTPSATAPPLAETLSSTPLARVALVLGHEGSGLTEVALRACTRLARIPTTAAVDSLNVSMAAGIALYELWCRTRSR